MEVPFLALGRRVEAIRPELDEAIASVLDGGRFVGGEPVEAFDRPIGWEMSTVLAVTAVVTLLFFVVPGPILDSASAAAAVLFPG